MLQALNDQNQAAIDERLATEGVKDWINHCALPEQLDNPIRQFKGLKNITCLAFASLVSDHATVRQLVEAGADIAVTDSWGHSLVHYACASDIDADAKVTYLMQSGASSQTTSSGWASPEFYSTSLRLAARLNQADRVRALIDDHGASVNDTDSWGSTPLSLAAEYGSAEAVDVLVSYPDCDFSIRDGDGDTAADCARVGGHHDLATLIEAKSKGSFTKPL